MQFSLATSALVLAFFAPAFGAERQVWDFYKSGKEARMSYGIPESDGITIIFRCETGKKEIEIVSSILPAKPRNGQAVKTTLTNGAITTSYDGKIGHQGEEGFYVVAYAAAEPKLVGVLTSGTSLTISVPGKRERVPLKGVAKPLAQFERACLGKR